MSRIIHLGLPALALLVSCSATEPTPTLPAGATPLAAPARYADWFDATERCAGLQGTYQSIQWYVVPGVTSFATSQGEKVGMWLRHGAGHVIVVAGAYQDHEMVVRHEMLHSLLGRSGHPDGYFAERCQLTWETWPTS